MGDEPDRRLQQGQRLPELQRQGRDKTAANDSGTAVSNLQWTYWALHDEDGYALLGANYTGLENPAKEYFYRAPSRPVLSSSPIRARRDPVLVRVLFACR